MILPFSQQFPWGEPTYFIEKIWKGFDTDITNLAKQKTNNMKALLIHIIGFFAFMIGFFKNKSNIHAEKLVPCNHKILEKEGIHFSITYSPRGKYNLKIKAHGKKNGYSLHYEYNASTIIEIENKIDQFIKNNNKQLKLWN